LTNLKAMQRSPAHFLASLKGRADNAALRLGRICHAVTLQDGAGVAVFEGARRQGKAWDDFKSAHEGAEIATPGEMATAVSVRDAVLAHPVASALLDGAAKETAIAWRHPLGLYCHSRIDIMRPGRSGAGGLVCDFKTCGDAQPDRFVWRARRELFYHAQLSFYADAIEASGQPRPEKYMIIAAEVVPPYAVVPFELTAAAVLQGAKLVRGWIERLRGCVETGEWPSYCAGVMPFDVPLDVDSLFDDDETGADLADTEGSELP
jgi:hypothetical protein